MHERSNGTDRDSQGSPMGAYAYGPAQQAQALTPGVHICKVVGPLTDLIHSCGRCEIHPLQFFVSWQGVLTLAYRGFPEPLAQLKVDLNEAMGKALPKENPGSKWPKTTLGCLRKGKRLTPGQLERLIAACRQSSEDLEQVTPLELSCAAVVLYTCRSLEEYLTWQRMDFCGPDGRGLDPPPDEVGRVQAVMAEADDPDYWVAASKDGNREDHYRGTHFGATLVCQPSWQDRRARQTAEVIAAFQVAVDEVLPGMYAWFTPASLHITIRALSA